MVIYKATNLINDKVYIGQTIQPFKQRRQDHISYALNRNSKKYFHNAIRKYGKDNFKWDIIDTSKNIKDLNKKEEYWISFYDSMNKEKGYNLTSGGLNCKLSEESKKRIGDIQRGKPKVSDERKKELSISMTGKRNHFYGRKHSEETKRKISESRKGKGLGQTELQKLKCPHRGSTNGRSSITEEIAIKIKEKLKIKIKDQIILKEFGITRNVLSGIKYGKTWKYLK